MSRWQRTKCFLKGILGFSFLVVWFGCQSKQMKQDGGEIDTVISNKAELDSFASMVYPESVLLSFLDSIEGLPTAFLVKQVDKQADSVFRSQIAINKTLSSATFEQLKAAIKNEIIEVGLAKAIFGAFQVDSAYLEQGFIPLSFFSFGPSKHAFKEFALCLGSTDMAWSCQLYFFQGNKLLSLHTIEHHYGLELRHYLDEEGKTMVYYTQNFGTGSGIWQFNYNFYRYDDSGLIPALNILQNGNLQSAWGMRIYWLKAYVKKTKPLSLGFEFYHELYDTNGLGHRILDKTALVKFKWDEASKQLKGDFSKAQINLDQTYAYYLGDNELLFINTHADLLRNCMKKPNQKIWALEYLNRMKNYCRKSQN